ncbi:MAG: hypothetical protein AB9903_15215 [Vulcanimicrobiota bacterium]
MRYLQFREVMKPFTLFSLSDIRRIDGSFHRARLNEWQDKGYIRKILRGYYMFADTQLSETVLFEIANRIYNPSYISFETALAYYGLIPESVYLVMSASTRKTSRFSTPVAEFSYRTIKPSLFWGYTVEHGNDYRYRIASPEKAVLDFFYLHTSWSSEDDFSELRVDKERFIELVNKTRLMGFLERFSHKELSKRIGRLSNYIYGKEQA